MGDSRRVLVVDDEPSIRMLVCGALERQGYEVAAAADGEEALALLRADGRRFDLVVTDITMPGMSGVELAEHAQVTHATPALLMSGSSPPAGLEPVRWLRKPFTLDALLSEVAALVPLPPA